jgi:integrase
VAHGIIEKHNPKTGKTKYQVRVYYEQKYYGAKTFQDWTSANDWKERRLTLARDNKIDPIPVKKQQARIERGLHQTLTDLAADFFKDPETLLCGNRKAEYRLAARLAAPYTLAHFQGREGGQRVRELQFGKFAAPARGKERRGKLSANSVRLRLTALLRLIHYGVSKLPNAVDYEPLDLNSFTLPPAHEAPRTRLATDREFTSLLVHLGPDSALATYLHFVDETGCRLSEILNGDRDHIDFFYAGGHVIGGCLRLDRHKTSRRIGPRQVPLSLFAAQLAEKLLKQSSSGRLFVCFRSNDAVCKLFDAACESLGIKDLQIKDFRRTFINRNKNAGVPTWDMLNVVGASDVLLKKAKEEKHPVQLAVGHTDPSTTAAYSVAHIEHLAEVFTGTSRFMQVRAAARQAPGEQPSPESTQELQKELSKLLARLRAVEGLGAPDTLAGAGDEPTTSDTSRLE